MNTVRAWRTLLRIDGRALVRDPMLRWFLLLVPGVNLLVRFSWPSLRLRLLASFGFDLAPYAPLLIAVLLLLAPLLLGYVVGFLLLDEKDDGTLEALQVTPLTAAQYLSYRLLPPLIAGTVLTLLTLPLTGLVDVSWMVLVGAALSAAAAAPLLALTLGGFAANKVQGFALTKALGIVMLAPMAGFFLPGSWRWLLGSIPLTWPALIYWEAGRSGVSAIWLLLPAAVVEGLALWLLVRRFRRVALR